MAKLTKRQQAFQGKVEAGKVYPAVEALNLVRQNATAKFDESVDVAIQLGIDPRKSDQAVRGAVVMPEGTGKTVRVAVFTQGAKADEARAAGADIVGFDDLAHKVKAGETIQSISKKRGVSIDKICQLNHLSSKSHVRPGQILRYS
jgi:large subunit ribosomal protein L1